MEKKFKDLKVIVRKVEVIENEQGGYIQLVMALPAERRYIRENFFLGEKAIENTLNSLGFWLRNQVYSPEDKFVTPDVAYLMEEEGMDYPQVKELVLELTVEPLKTLIGKEIEVHQVTTSVTNKLEITKNYTNINPWKLQDGNSIVVDEDTEIVNKTDLEGFL